MFPKRIWSTVRLLEIIVISSCQPFLLELIFCSMRKIKHQKTFLSHSSGWKSLLALPNHDWYHTCQHTHHLVAHRWKTHPGSCQRLERENLTPFSGMLKLSPTMIFIHNLVDRICKIRWPKSQGQFLPTGYALRSPPFSILSLFI